MVRGGVLCCALVAACGGSGGSSDLVQTADGPISGTRDENLHVFRGIPYAAPPVGPRRFTKPVRPAPWGPEPVYAHEFPEPCAQPGTAGTLGSEDCLYLNVWSPDMAGKRPVMVWIHGGFFVTGATNIPLYDGAELARRGDVVVVSLQYRLGTFGHLAHASLATDDDPGAGNYAMYDQYMALAWIQREIANFGGDPGNVTIFGESAGGTSVCTAVASPLANGLFHKAIVQSQHCLGRPLDLARERGDAFAEDTECNDAACLRSLSTDEVIEAQYDPRDGGDVAAVALSYMPTVDGTVLPDTPEHIIKAREHNAVPIISMSLSEDSFFLLSVYTWEFLDAAAELLGIPEQTRADIATYYQTEFSLLRGYPLDYDRGMLATDFIIVCPESQQLRWFAGNQEEPVYRLLFDWAPPGFYKQHAFELPYLFQALLLPEIAAHANSDTDRWAEETMLKLWTSFARTGAPPDDVSWPAFTVADESFLTLGEQTLVAGTRLRQDACAQYGIFDD